MLRRLALRLKSLRPDPHLFRAVDRALRVALEIERRIEKRMDGIADDLVDHAAMLHHDRGHALDVLVEHGDELLGTCAMRHRA